MRIVFVSNEYPPEPHGGIGTFVSTMGRLLTSRGHHVTVVGYSRQPKEYTDGAVRVMRLRGSELRGLAWYINRRRLWSWLRREALSNRIDILEVPEFGGLLPFSHPPGTGAVVVRLHQAGTTIAQHVGHSPSPALRWCEKSTLRHHGAWLTASRHALNLAVKVFGVEPTRWALSRLPVAQYPMLDAPPPMAGRYVLYAGTVSEAKGVLLVAEAARRFLHEERDLNMVFVGPIAGSRTDPLDRRILRLVGSDLEGRVHFTGRLSQESVRRWMRHAQALLFASRLEALGLVVLEALAERCPVITLDQPPFNEYLENGRTAQLVPPDPGAMAKAVSRLLEQPDWSSHMREEGAHHVATSFSPDSCVESTLSFYEGLLRSGGYKLPG